jgi:lysophospholipase L1-like esterase
MRTRLATALAALIVPVVVLVAALAGSGSATAASTDVGYRIMPLGDSITFGLGAPGSYRTDLWQKLTTAGASVDFVGSVADTSAPEGLRDRDHEGHSGWTIQQIRDCVTTWQQAYRPATILLHIGTSDMYGSDPAGAPERLAALVDTIVANNPDVQLFVASIIPLGFSAFDDEVDAYNDAIPGIVAAKAATGAKVVFVDLNATVTTSDLTDGVHPDDRGYAAMAAGWWSALQQYPAAYGKGASTSTPPTTTQPTSTPPTSTVPSTTLPTSTTTTTSTTLPTTTVPTGTTSRTKTTRITTVKKCRTAKNGKKTCRTILKTITKG